VNMFLGLVLTARQVMKGRGARSTVTLTRRYHGETADWD
jgi:hypothetical protein